MHFEMSIVYKRALKMSASTHAANSATGIPMFIICELTHWPLEGPVLNFR